MTFLNSYNYATPEMCVFSLLFMALVATFIACYYIDQSSMKRRTIFVTDTETGQVIEWSYLAEVIIRPGADPEKVKARNEKRKIKASRQALKFARSRKGPKDENFSDVFNNLDAEELYSAFRENHEFVDACPLIPESIQNKVDFDK